MHPLPTSRLKNVSTCGFIIMVYYDSLSSGSDISTQTHPVRACTHTLFMFARELVCAISLGAYVLELLFVNKRAKLLPADGETGVYELTRVVPYCVILNCY